MKGNATLLKAEKKEWKDNQGKDCKYYTGSILTTNGDVIKVSMNETVFNSVKMLTAQNIFGEVELLLKSSTFGGKETIKVYLLKFSEIKPK